MAWDMTPVKDTGTIKTPLDQIPQDVKDSVDEAYEYCQANPGYRLTAAFADQDEAERNRVLIRNYCELRPERLTASIHAGFAGTTEDGNVIFRQSKSDAASQPALSLYFSKYVKRSRSESNGQSTEAADANATANAAA